MNKKLYYALLIVMEIFTISALCVGIWTFNANRSMSTVRDIEISEDGEAKSKFMCRIDGMLPGDSYSYTVNLKASKLDNYRVDMEFIKKGDIALASYITVDVLIDEEIVHSVPLSKCFDGNDFTVNVDFSQKSERVMRIAYTLPAETDDSAQGAIAKFDAVMRISRG